MANTNMVIVAKDLYGKASNTTIKYVNPDLTNEQVATLGAMLNQFTTNTYQYTNRIDTQNADLEAGKAEPTFTVSAASASYASFATTEFYKEIQTLPVFTFSGDTQPIVPITELKNSGFYSEIRPMSANSFALNLKFKISDGEPTLPQTFTFTLPETANYKSKSVTFTITA